MTHPLYAIVDRNGDEYRRANDIAHPHAQVVDARDLPRLPRRRA